LTKSPLEYSGWILLGRTDGLISRIEKANIISHFPNSTTTGELIINL